MANEQDPGQQTWLAAERTWLAWWRTGLAAAAVALAIGRLVPQLVDTENWPYVALGAGYAVVAMGLFVAGALRERRIKTQLRSGAFAPVADRWIEAFTVLGVGLALATLVLVIAQL